MKVYCICIHYHCWDICSGQELWRQPWLITHVIYQQIPPSNSLQTPQPFSPPSLAFVLVAAALPTQSAFAFSSFNVFGSQHLEWASQKNSKSDRPPLLKKSPNYPFYSAQMSHLSSGPQGPVWSSPPVLLPSHSPVLFVASPSTC